MGLLRWMRGGDDNSAAGNALGAGMAEIDALFRPSKHKQTEHVQESRRRRVDIGNGADSDIDLDNGIAVIRRRDRAGAASDAPDDAVLDNRADDAPTAPLSATARRHAPHHPARRGCVAGGDDHDGGLCRA